jgi:hypothetical protein
VLLGILHSLQVLQANRDTMPISVSLLYMCMQSDCVQHLLLQLDASPTTVSCSLGCCTAWSGCMYEQHGMNMQFCHSSLLAVMKHSPTDLMHLSPSCMHTEHKRHTG